MLWLTGNFCIYKNTNKVIGKIYIYTHTYKTLIRHRTYKIAGGQLITDWLQRPNNTDINIFVQTIKRGKETKNWNINLKGTVNTSYN